MSEFDDSMITAHMIRERWGQLERHLTETLTELPAEALLREVVHPRRGRLSGFEVLVVAMRHAAEHMGQAELTRDLILAHHPQT